MSCERPPLGCKPRKIWLEDRIEELEAAIGRHEEMGTPLPEDGDWIDELEDRRDELYEMNNPDAFKTPEEAAAAEPPEPSQLYGIPPSTYSLWKVDPAASKPLTAQMLEEAKQSITSGSAITTLSRNYCREILNQWHKRWFEYERQELQRLIYGQSLVKIRWDKGGLHAESVVCTCGAPIMTCPIHKSAEERRPSLTARVEVAQDLCEAGWITNPADYVRVVSGAAPIAPRAGLDKILAAANARRCAEHQVVDTGMRKSWCKVCNANMAMDARGAWMEVLS